MKSLCGQLFKYAIDLEIVTTNFASLVEMPPHEQSEIHKPFSEEELKILWANTDDKDYSQLRYDIWEKSSVKKSLSTRHLPHDGRHTCATLLDNAEVPLKIRQLILGHSSQDITNRVYTHKTLQQLLNAINQI